MVNVSNSMGITINMLKIPMYTPVRSGGMLPARHTLASLRQACQEGSAGPARAAQKTSQLGDELFKACYREFADSFDEAHGGFGQAPKFPSLHNLLFLLKVYERFAYPRALDMVEKTLAAIRNGGVYDHVGFGMHRYATDSAWLVPHFEKMLYDQAMLLLACSETFRVTGKPLYKEIAGEVVEYVLRDLTGPDGAFYTAEDADSQGEEGKFYVFTRDEIYAQLGEEDGKLAEAWHHIEADGNFHDEESKEKTGANILHVRDPRAWFADKHKMTPEELDGRLESIRRRLLAYRNQRVRPLCDDKTLTDLNGLMLAALARGGALCGRPDWIAAAQKSADFILSTLVRPDESGALLHRYRDGEAGLPAHLDDYAFLAWGLSELWTAASEPRWLTSAVAFMDALVEKFWDARAGGFFFTSADQTDLPVRPKDFFDNAIPGGNSVALMLLTRLGREASRPDFLDKARGMRQAVADAAARAPAAYAFLLAAAMEAEA